MKQKTANRSIDIIKDSETWAKEVWSRAEKPWLDRDGQDSFYRDNVIIPALVNSVKSRISSRVPIDIVDVGSGDGYCTEHFIYKAKAASYVLGRKILLDRSIKQLQVAKGKDLLADSEILQCDLNDPNWHAILPKDLSAQKVVTSIFVVQEIPELSPMLSGLRALLEGGGVGLIVTVAPQYSNILRRKKSIQNILPGTNITDWSWRGLYPIDGAAGRFYLPHFHRTIKDYKTLLSKNELKCVEVEYLSVPHKKEAEKIFSNTVYGKHILKTRSSVLLTVMARR